MNFLVRLTICWMALVSPSYAQLGTIRFSGASVVGTGGAFVQLPIGSGGLVSGLVISASGKQFVRTDTATGNFRTSHNSKFVPVVTSSSMPSGDIVIGNGAAGICAIAIAPSNDSHVYMYFAPAILGNNTTSPPYVYSSTNNAATWAHTTNQPAAGTCNANNHSGTQPSVSNEYMDVSPGNENAVYLGTLSSGVYYTLNAGASAWTQISTGTIPAGGGNGNLIKFDPSDATGNTVYISSYGNGIWKCTSALSAPSCVELNSAGMPTTFKNLYVDPLGTVWVVDNSSGTSTGNVLRYLSGTWSTQITGTVYTAVTVDPANTSYAIALNVSGGIVYSTNAQAGTPTWTTVNTTIAACSGGTTAVLSTVVPWQQWRNDCSLDANNMAFDPSQSHVLYMGNGDGLYKITPPISGSPPIQWNADETVGIENLDLTAGMALSGGGLGFTAQDRPLWFTTNPSSYPAQYYPTGSAGTTTSIRWGTGLCDNASANTYAGINFGLVGTAINGFTVSTTGINGTYTAAGTTGLPGGTSAGTCAILTLTNWVWFPNQGQGPYFTNNSGASWSACTFGGGKTAGGGGWVGLAQDTTAPGTLLIVNEGNGSTNGAGAEGIWKSTSTSACAFTQQATTLPTGLISTLVPVPGVPCNFALTVPADIGQAPNPSFQNVFLTTDCGATYSVSISKLFSAYAMNFGKANPAHDGYPALYCQCYADDGSGVKFGLFQIDNTDTITTPIVTNLDAVQGGYPAGNLDHMLFIVGDLATYGTLYCGFSGSGGCYRTLNFLLKRDLDPVSNDNDPMWLNKAA